MGPAWVSISVRAGAKRHLTRGRRRGAVVRRCCVLEGGRRSGCFECRGIAVDAAVYASVGMGAAVGAAVGATVGVDGVCVTGWTREG